MRNHLLCTLENTFQSLSLWHHITSTVVAYADDVRIFVTTPTDIPKVKDAIHCYEAMFGARVKLRPTPTSRFS